MEYSIDSLEDLQRKIVHIENELSDIRNQLTLIVAKSNKNRVRPSLDFPVDSYGSWPQNLSLRREDIYDDNGR